MTAITGSISGTWLIGKADKYIGDGKITVDEWKELCRDVYQERNTKYTEASSKRKSNPMFDMLLKSNPQMGQMLAMMGGDIGKEDTDESRAAKTAGDNLATAEDMVTAIGTDFTKFAGTDNEMDWTELQSLLTNGSGTGPQVTAATLKAKNGGTDVEVPTTYFDPAASTSSSGISPEILKIMKMMMPQMASMLDMLSPGSTASSGVSRKHGEVKAPGASGSTPAMDPMMLMMFMMMGSQQAPPQQQYASAQGGGGQDMNALLAQLGIG
jgi:hypothetical protein